MINFLAKGIRSTAADARKLVLEGVDRFNATDLRSPGVWGLLAFFSLGSVFTYDLSIKRFQSEPDIGLLLLSQLVFLCLYAISAVTLKPGTKNRASYFAVALAGMVVVKAWLIELAFQSPNQEIIPGFLNRLPGDLSLMFVLVYIANALNFASNRHQSTLHLLQSSKEELRQKQLAAKQSALQTDLSLSQLAQEALGKPLDQLKKKLEGTKKWDEIRLLSSEIRELINSQVRPLSNKLRQQVETLDSTKEISIVPKPVRFRIPKNLDAHRDVDLLTVFMVAMPNIWITTFTLGGWSLLLMSLAVSALILPIGYLVQKSLRKVKPHTLVGNWFLSNVLLLGAFLPMQVLFFLFSKIDSNVNPLRISGVGVFIGVGLMFALLSAVEFGRRETEHNFESLNLELARETAVVEQQVWVARKKWAYLVHGTVQGALTVAASRLQLADEKRPADINRIIADLDKAARALSGQIVGDQRMEEVITEIKQTWEGVLDIEVATSRRAKAVVDNPLSSRAITELIKELAGNAYRHGEASKLYVAIDLDENLDIAIRASNNGKPFSEMAQLGLGSKLFDDLTMSWSQTQDAGGVNFLATLPAIYPRSESSQALAEA